MKPSVRITNRLGELRTLAILSQSLAALLAALLLATPAVADKKAAERYRNYTPKEIAALPEKMRESSVPMVYISAAQTGMALDSELLFGMQLNSLMYPGLHDYQAAVKAYQRDLGDQPNGVLTVWQIHQLAKRSEIQKLSRVNFPVNYSSHFGDGYAVIEGTLIIHDDKIAYPVNHVRIECHKQARRCQFSQMTMSFPDDDSWAQTFSVQSPTTEDYVVSSWTKDSIDTQSRETMNSCRAISLALNFKTKEFYYITRNAGGTCNVLGTPLPKLGKPRIAQVVDGQKIQSDEFEQLEKTAYKFLASDFRQKVDAAIAREKKK